MSGARVLVVDDAPELRLIMRVAFGQAGLHVSEVTDGAEAVEYLQEQRPDVMVLDLRMPVLDGFGVLDWMEERGLLTTIPVLVLTAWADPSTKTALQTRGCQWLAKPFDIDTLVEKVKTMAAKQV